LKKECTPVTHRCGSSKLLPYEIPICRTPLCPPHSPAVNPIPSKTVGEDLDPPANVRFPPECTPVTHRCGSSKLLPYGIPMCRISLCPPHSPAVNPTPSKTVGEDLDPPANVRFPPECIFVTHRCGSSKLLPYGIPICRIPLCPPHFPAVNPPKTVGEDLDPPANVRFPSECTTVIHP